MCWITNSKAIGEDIRGANRMPIQEQVKRGLMQQLIKEQRIRDEYDRYASYVVEEGQWEGLEDSAWGDASGQVL